MTAKEAAKILYMTGDFSQKQIAETFDVSEATMSSWVKKLGWEDERMQKLSTEREIERRAKKAINYTLQCVETEIDNNISEGKFKPIDSKTIDSLSKILKAVKPAEVKLVQVIDLCSELVTYIQQNDLELAKQLLSKIDGFINYKRVKLQSNTL